MMRLVTAVVCYGNPTSALLLLWYSACIDQTIGSVAPLNADSFVAERCRQWFRMPNRNGGR
jgi:hypothetical protein